MQSRRKKRDISSSLLRVSRLSTHRRLVFSFFFFRLFLFAFASATEVSAKIGFFGTYEFLRFFSAWFLPVRKELPFLEALTHRIRICFLEISPSFLYFFFFFLNLG